MKKFVISVVVFFCVQQWAWSQRVELSDTVSRFGDQVSVLLSDTKNEEAVKIGNDFNALWSGSFSPSQQKTIIDIALRMQDRQFNPVPYFRDFFGVLTSGTNNGISGSKMDNLLKMLSRSLEVNTVKNFSREMVNLRVLFEKEALHFSKFNSLYISNADMDFEFVEPEEAIEEPEIVEEPEETEDDWGDDDWGDSWGDEVKDENDTEDVWGTPDTGINWGGQNEDEPVAEESIALSTYTYSEEPLPEIKGAVVKFNRADFTITTYYDSTTLSGTKGSWMINKYTFVGEGGKFDWSSAGMDPDQVYVNLSEYSFNTRNPYILASKTKLTNREKFSGEIEGLFEFKSVKHDGPDKAAYPRFMSYENNIRLEIPEDKYLEYIGGYSLLGNKSVGASAHGKISQLNLTTETGRKFRTSSKKYIFEDSIITAFHTNITIYHGHDSVTHPSVKMRYYIGDHRFMAIKEKGGWNLRPFNSSYYNMSIEADLINWDIESDSMDISIMNARSMLPAYFKSTDYYEFNEIKEMTGVYKFNPLFVVYNYGTKHKTRKFYVSDLVNELKLNEKAVRGAMMHLYYLDFIDYEETSGTIYIKDKAIHFVQSKNNRKDFDDVLIPSLISDKPNATLNTETNELTVRGIDKFYISEMLDVYIFPRENEIRLNRNRDFEFDGQLFAGNFEFVGREFTFRYDSFLVDMQTIDSIRFYLNKGEGKEKTQVDNKLVSYSPEEDSTGVESNINLSQTKGTLFINRPDNKSGRKIYPQYPRFDASMGAVVYFDGPDILDGAYDRSLYFVVPPFTIDSLSSGDASTIGFEGTFVSGGIVPEFKEKLKIMDDNSLGFTHTIPQNGFELYNTSGRIYDQLKMDKNGMVGNGSIDYLTSSFESENFVFHLDSLVADGANFRMNRGTLDTVSYPDITTNLFSMNWEPKKDKMVIKNQEGPFNLYNNSASLDGSINVTTKGTYGAGVMFTRGFEAHSRRFAFQERNLSARHAFFELKSDNPKKPLLAGEDIRLEFDLVNDIAEISPEREGVAAINFPYAQVKTSISKATWNLNENTVVMEKQPDVPIENSYFYATRKELDSLAFNAESAEYNLGNSQLKVFGIPYIIVADAMITPENNQVLILENAQIGELYNTTIVIDTLNEYHRLVDGTINIHSRNEFSGDATYEYVNILNDTFNIKFGKFELEKVTKGRNKGLQTVSSGEITEEDRLIISEGMFFKGSVTMYARSKALELDGLVKFDFQNRPDYTTWIKYQSADEEAQEVKFDFNAAKTQNDESLNAGLHYSTDNELYTAFAEDKKSSNDFDFFVPDGILYFNSERKMYMIEDTAKVNGSKLTGKVFGYSDRTGDVEFEGPVRFFLPNDHVTLTSNGFGVGNINTNKYRLNSLLKVDMDMPSQVFTLMGQDVFEVVENYGAAEAESDRDMLLYKIAEIVGERAAFEYDQKAAQEYTPVVSVSNKMVGSLVFTKLNLEWSQERKAWYNVGKIGLSNINTTDINASIDGFVEIKRTEEGEILNIFLQIAPDCWYFFNYQENRLFVYSSNGDFVDAVASKSKIEKAGFGEYAFTIADYQDALNFVNRFRSEYLGINDPFEINMPVQKAPEPDIMDAIDEPLPDDGFGDTVEPSDDQQPEPQEEEDLLDDIFDDGTKPSKKDKKERNDDEGF